MNPDEITIAETLKNVGYKTGIFGKWHMGDQWEFLPLRQGSDEYYGIPYSNDMWPGNLNNHRHTKEPYTPLTVIRDEEVIAYVSDGMDQALLSRAIIDEAIEFIDENQAKPFFLYLPYYAVHAPFEAKVGLVNKYNEKLKTDTSQKNATYAAMVENLDQCVGRIMQALHKSGQDENTIFVLTSDNGGLSLATNNAPLREGKGFLYEGGIRVPMLIRYPEQIEAGLEIDTPASTTDLFATICGLANVSVPEKVAVDSLNLVPALNGKAEKNRALHWYYPHYAPQAKMPGAVIRQGDWKLIEFYRPPHVELYNISQDVSEKNDLASSMPELTSQMNQQLHTWLKSVDPIMHTANPDYQP